MKKLITLALAGMLICASLAACTQTPAESKNPAETQKPSVSQTEEPEDKISGEVVASGSSALLPLAQVAADLFMDTNDEVIVTVNGGGSGTGLTQVADGTVDIGNSDVFAEEKLDPAVAEQLVDHRVCTVTMAAVVNKDLGLEGLSKEELISIFTGEVKNWSEVGGPDIDIMLVTRPTSSGTRALFKTYAMDGAEESSESALETDDSGTLLQTVESNAGAIGYVALSYLVNNDTVKAVSIDGVEPTLENTYNGTYPVWGYEHCYTKGEATGATKAFLDYMMSDEFAPEIEKLGYGASSKLTAEAIASHE